MILQFNKVIIHNFGSYADAELQLTDRGFCAVSGKNNYKKDNALSNGSGKSMLWSAICFALTGETISGLKSNLKNINIDEDECWVALDFNADNDHYFLTRIYRPKSDLKIIRNDVDESGKGIRESEQKLAELLPDLTKNLIASTIIIGQGMPNKFSSFTPSGRKELLEKLTKSDFMIEDIKERLAARQLELQKQFSAVNTSLLLNNQQLANDVSELNKVKLEVNNLVKPDYATLIKKAEAQILDISKDISETNINITELDKLVENLNEQLIQLSNEKADQYSRLTEDFNAATSTLIQEKLDLELKTRELNAEILRLKSIRDICPTCGQRLIGVEKPDTTEKELELKSLQEELNSRQLDLDHKKASCDKYSLQIEEAFKTRNAAVRQQLIEVKNSLDQAKNKLNDLSHYESIEKEKLTKLNYEKDTFDTYLKNLQATITRLTESTSKLQTLIDVSNVGKTDIEEHLAVTKKMDTLIKRDFRGYLLSDIINYIDQKAKEYCEIVFGTNDLNVQLDGNNLDITYCNKVFDNLSGGEKQRCDLILQFAIRDLLQTYLGYSSNIIVLDEIFDNLDKVATDKILALITTELKDIESIFIISHHSDELEIPVDSEIKVIKNEDGVSEIY